MLVMHASATSVLPATFFLLLLLLVLILILLNCSAVISLDAHEEAGRERAPLAVLDAH
jgi:uncharacterized protein YceK